MLKVVTGSLFSLRSKQNFYWLALTLAAKDWLEPKIQPPCQLRWAFPSRWYLAYSFLKKNVSVQAYSMRKKSVQFFNDSVQKTEKKFMEQLQLNWKPSLHKCILGVHILTIGWFYLVHYFGLAMDHFWSEQLAWA